MIWSRWQVTACVGMMASAFALSGCGYKAPPVAPETVVPVAINDLHYSVNSEETTFTWSYPLKTVAGDKVEDIEYFELYQAEMNLEDVCVNCPIPFNEPIQIPGGSVYDGKKKSKGSYSISSFDNGKKYFFTIRSKANWWATSDDSNIVSFTYFTPPMAVRNFVATPGDTEVALSWQKVNQLADGSDAPADLLYQVQRASTKGGFSNVGTAQTETSLVDRRVAIGKQYRYRVQTLMLYGDDLVQGLFTPVVVTGPLDLVAPSTPKALRVVELSAGNKLIWDRVELADLGGYRIYRSKRGASSMEQIAEIGPQSATYTDPQKGNYVYSVSAIDSAEPANESGRTIAIGPR